MHSSPHVHRFELRTRFYELDPYEHVNHTAYFGYFEAGRVEALAEAGYGLDVMKRAGFQIVLIEVNARFMMPAGLHETLLVTTSVVEMTRATSRWHQDMTPGERSPGHPRRQGRLHQPGRPPHPPPGRVRRRLRQSRKPNAMSVGNRRDIALGFDSEELGDPGVGGGGRQSRVGAGLDHPAVTHDRHPIGDGQGLVVVVGDVDGRRSFQLEKAADVFDQPFSEHAVEGPDRFVEHHQRRPGGQSSGQGHALLLSARKPIDPAVGQPLQADPSEHLLDPGSRTSDRR